MKFSGELRVGLAFRRYGLHDRANHPLFIDRFGSADYALKAKLLGFDLQLMKHIHHMELLSEQYHEVRRCASRM